MKNKITSTLASTKTFVNNHKVGLTATGCAIIGVALLRGQQSTFTTFLAENEMTDKFNDWLTDDIGA